MTIHADGILKNATKTLKKTALVMDQVLVLGTPVDTGRARASWTATVAVAAAIADVGLNPYSDDVEANKSASSAAALAQGIVAIQGYKAGAGSIFLVNTVFYIFELDEGKAEKQAPEVTTREALIIGSAIIKDAPLITNP